MGKHLIGAVPGPLAMSAACLSLKSGFASRVRRLGLQASIVFGVSLTALGFTSSSAQATLLYETDWKTSGDKLLVRDDLTSLDWLDLTQTQGMSFQTVNDNLGVGGFFEGFSLATRGDVVLFWQHADIPLTFALNSAFCDGLQCRDPILSLMAQVGVLDRVNENRPTEMRTSTGFTSSFGVNAGTVILGQLAAQPLEGHAGFSGALQTVVSSSLGAWLFRPSIDVPEPAILALLGLGLAGIGFARRRKG